MLEKTPQYAKARRKREQAIAHLLVAPTLRQAAKKIGVHEQTLLRWLKDPDFAREYQAARERILDRATEALRDGSLEAVQVLREVLGNRRAPASSRVMACRTFLESTALLRGNTVTVNNQIIPQDAEGLTAEIIKQLGGMLRTDVVLREAVKAMLVEIEEKNEPTVN
jgi:hypothetical protein